MKARVVFGVTQCDDITASIFPGIVFFSFYRDYSSKIFTFVRRYFNDLMVRNRQREIVWLSVINHVPDCTREDNKDIRRLFAQEGTMRCYCLRPNICSKEWSSLSFLSAPICVLSFFYHISFLLSFLLNIVAGTTNSLLSLCL